MLYTNKTHIVHKETPITTLTNGLETTEGILQYQRVWAMRGVWYKHD